MKITCGVEISNRSASSTVRNRKFNVATLALCNKPTEKKLEKNENVFLMLCTHQSPRGTQYKIHNNVEKMFTRFINDGKATVRFKEPPHDVIISKADPLQLKGFLHGVGLTIVGKGNDKIKFSSSPTKVERPKKKFSIAKRDDYPTKAGFPNTLTWLQIQNCNLKKIENRILRLENLQCLDLSENCLKELPSSMGNLRLKDLKLRNNKLSEFPAEFSTQPLGQNLQLLDLSFNEIRSLSPYFCLMKKLRTLSLKANILDKLPRNIHCLESLRMFSASHNGIKVLPFGIRKLQLDTLDLFHNPLDTDVVLRPLTLWQVPTLKEIAAAAVVNYDLKIGPMDLPRSLIDYVVEHCPCPCGKKVFQFESSCILVLDLYKLASTVVYINNTSRFKVPLEVYFCSTKCWKKFYSFTANQRT